MQNPRSRPSGPSSPVAAAPAAGKPSAGDEPDPQAAIGKPADFAGFAPLVAKRHPHAVQIKHPHQRIGKARRYSFLIGVDPHCRKRRQRRHVAERAAQCLQFAVIKLIHLVQWPSPRSTLLGGRPSSLQLGQKLIRGNEEWILLKNPADDHLRVGTQYVHHRGRTELIEVVGANDHVIVFWQNVI